MQKLEEWDINSLIEHANNPRKNDHAVDKTAAAIRQFGFRVPIIAKSDGTVIDGHLRLKAAKKLKLKTVPVLVADDMTETQIKAFRLSVNKIAELADWDDELLKIELEELKELDFNIDLTGFDIIDLEKMLLNSDDELPETIEEVSDDLPGAQSLKVDMHFPSKLKLGMPELKYDMLADIPEKIATWAGRDATPDDGESLYFWNWRTDSLRGAPKERLGVSFYTDDYRFENVWDEPSKYVAKMLNIGCQIAISPNFSLWHGQATALHIYQTFKSRWTARYMQEAGIKIIPDINWADETSFDFCLLGIPKNTPALSVQLQTIKTDDEVRRCITGLNIALNELQPRKLLVYGHKIAKKVIDNSGYNGDVVFIENRTALRRNVINSKGE